MFIVQEFDEKNLEDLTEEWTGLCEKCIKATPFQYPQWLLPWWKNFGGSILKLLVFRSEGELVGVAPFFIYKTDSGTRKLCQAGTGISDYLDMVSLQGYEEKCLQGVVEYLSGTNNQWDECDFQDLPEGSLLLRVDLGENFRVERLACNVCTYVELPSSAESLPKQFPKKLRKDLRRAERELMNKGEYKMEIAAQQNVDEFLHELFRLHGARWQSKNQTGVLNGKSLLKFHRESAPHLLKEGLLRLYLMRSGGTAIASYYVLSKGVVDYAYLGGFDPAMEDFSPGKLALFNVMLDSIARGSEIVDFLRGEEPYKYQWRPMSRHNYRIRITREGM